MIQSNKNLCHEINILINILKSSDEEIYSKKIENALSISTVPGEVWGETRLIIVNLNSTQLPKKLGIEYLIQDILDYLNKIL